MASVRVDLIGRPLRCVFVCVWVCMRTHLCVCVRIARISVRAHVCVCVGALCNNFSLRGLKHEPRQVWLAVVSLSLRVTYII